MSGTDEPKTASYSIQAKLLKLFVQRPYAVWALDHVAWVGRINKDQGDPECECNRRLCSGMPRADARSGGLPRYHQDDARGLP